ncbi:hypothetical protein Q8F55_007653 [Vanrija albida]|uniref:Uncharacterized protein n=1 Tax=Vanrija albida TaxID=181172 RepID=A0ABR3PU53_9TREE
MSEDADSDSDSLAHVAVPLRISRVEPSLWPPSHADAPTLRRAGGALAACTLLDVRGDVSRPAARLARALTRVRSVRYAPDQAGRYATRVALPRAATAVVYAAACAAPELSSARIVLGAAVSRLVLCPAGAAALPEISGGALREVVVRLSDVEEGHVPEDVGERRAWLAATVRAAAALAPAAEVALVDLAAVKPSFWGCKHQPGAYVRKFLQDEVLGAAAGVTWLSAAEYASRVGPAQLALEMAPWCGPSE